MRIKYLSDLPDITYREFFLWLLGLRRRYRVSGNSMLPQLKPGEDVLIDRQAYKDKIPQPQDLVVAFHPNKTELKIIKRIATVSRDRGVFLLGDNPLESTDSRDFGVISLDALYGKVTSRFGSQRISENAKY